jgi:drug/metabolite transporter (DMT)-like permease
VKEKPASSLSASTVLLLTVPPLLWAGNAIVGRLVREAVPPMTLNLLRWTIALLVLLPLGRAALRTGSGVLANWRRYALLGLLGIGMYNSLQYLALQSSTPINVTLVASGMPVWMVLVGRLFYGVPVRGRQVGGAVLSIAGVLVVLCRGDLEQLLGLRLVAGDLYMILATIAWSFYSWMLLQPKDVPALRADWASCPTPTMRWPSA